MRITVFKECREYMDSRGAPFRIAEYPWCADHATWIGRIDGEVRTWGPGYATVLRDIIGIAREAAK